MKEVMYDYFYQIEDKHWWFQSRRKIVTKLIDKYYKTNADTKVLDVGCGTGMMLKYLAKYGEVWGIDKNKKAVEYSKKKTPKAKVLLGSVPEQMPEEKFDLVTALDIIEHIDKDVEALKSVASILKKDGLFVVTVPAYRFLWSAHDKINEHKRRYTLPEIKMKLEQAGFKIKKISYYNTFLFLPILLRISGEKLLYRGKAKFHFEKLPNRFINGLLKIIFSFERYFLPILNFPFGVSIIAFASK